MEMRATSGMVKGREDAVKSSARPQNAEAFAHRSFKVTYMLKYIVGKNLVKSISAKRQVFCNSLDESYYLGFLRGKLSGFFEHVALVFKPSHTFRAQLFVAHGAPAKAAAQIKQLARRFKSREVRETI